jgi:small subunit ribosomal protein S3
MRLRLDDLIGKKIQVNIQEIRQPELDAYLVAKTIAEQIERRIAYRRATKQAVFRTIQAGAKGVRVSCAGRLGGAEIARRQTIHQGQVPLHTLRADIDYGFAEAHTTLGLIGIKVWIYKGDILPEPKAVEIEEAPTDVVATDSPEVEPTAEPEKGIAEPVAARSPEAEPTVKLKEKPAKPRATRKVQTAASAEPEKGTAEPTAEISPETEPTVKLKEKDVTTQAGEIPQDS